jgi:hypothetical protein
VGQSIEVQANVTGDVAVFETDRTLTGQDAESFSGPGTGSIAADLATRLFEGDERIDRVFAHFNVVSVERSGGWDDAALEQAAEIIRTLFRVYG